MKAIFPVLIADKDGRGFLDFPFQHFSKLSSLPSIKTKQKLVAICLANGIPLSEKAVRRSVKEVVAEITQNQGVKMSELGAEIVAMSTCEKRLFDKVSNQPPYHHYYPPLVFIYRNKHHCYHHDQSCIAIFYPQRLVN